MLFHKDLAGKWRVCQINIWGIALIIEQKFPDFSGNFCSLKHWYQMLKAFRLSSYLFQKLNHKAQNYFFFFLVVFLAFFFVAFFFAISYLTFLSIFYFTENFLFGNIFNNLIFDLFIFEKLFSHWLNYITYIFFCNRKKLSTAVK
jgi:hypothetical protein